MFARFDSTGPDDLNMIFGSLADSPIISVILTLSPRVASSKHRFTDSRRELYGRAANPAIESAQLLLVGKRS